MPFDESKALRVKTFCENLKCTQGEWAGRPFILIPWQYEDVIRPLFATLRDDGMRRYRFCYVEIPKKNGKSPLSAAIGLYMLCADGEASPEVYIAAADREQAGYVFRYAAQMARENDVLMKNLKIADSRRRIINHRNNGFMQVLSSESYTKHGINPSCLIFDELHAQPNDELWNTLTSGTDYARRQQVVLALSTAGIFDKNSIWWRTREKARQIRDGIIVQNNFLPVLYIADPVKDNPEDEELWKQVNPSLGHIFTLEKIREQFNEVKNDPVEYQNFLRFRLNIPVKQLSRWMPMDKWDRCNDKPDIESLRGRMCFGGLDLSSKIDLAAFILVFPPSDPEGSFDVVCRFYCPEEGILKRSRTDRVRYDIWQKQGFLTATPGNVIDYAWIKKDVFQAAKDHDLREIAFDSWNAQATATDIMNELNPSNSENGFQMVEVRQGAKSMNEPAKDLLVHVMTEKIRHGAHPVLRWNADNLVMRSDPNGNVAPDKERATEKIDGMVALIMAWSRSMLKSEPAKSVYDGLTAEEIKSRMAY